MMKPARELGSCWHSWRSSDFSAHHETLARAIAVPLPHAASATRAPPDCRMECLTHDAGINRSNHILPIRKITAPQNLSFRSTNCQSIFVSLVSILVGLQLVSVRCGVRLVRWRIQFNLKANAWYQGRRVALAAGYCGSARRGSGASRVAFSSRDGRSRCRCDARSDCRRAGTVYPTRCPRGRARPAR
jgi:hypothetical protein